MVTQAIDHGTRTEHAPVPAHGNGSRSPSPRSGETLERWEAEAEADAAVFRAAGAAATPRDSHDPVQALDLLLAGARNIVDTDWHDLPGRRSHEALDALEQLDRTLAAVRADVLATIDADGLWALDGQRTFTSWLRTRVDTTAGAASRQVRTARALRDDLPLARQALADGTISSEHAGLLVREARRTTPLREQLADEDLGESFLVDQAGKMDAGTFAKVVRAWAIGADPDGADRAWRDAGAKEELTLARTLDGFHVSGWLDDSSGQLVTTALQAYMGRKAKDDERTAGQRRAAALVGLAHQALDSGQLQPHARIRPHLTVTTSWETLQALVAASGSVVPPRTPDGEDCPTGAPVGITADATLSALGGPQCEDAEQTDLFSLSDEARKWLDTWQPGDDHVIPAAIDPAAMTGVQPATLEDGTPISPALLARLVCDSGLSRVMFGPESTVLDVGREQRIFPANMVKAILARDRHCQAPDCDAPPGFGEIHHALQWYRDGGPTSVDHGLFVCWHHHDWVHANSITIVRSDGRWCFYDRHGLLITGKSDRGS